MVDALLWWSNYVRFSLNIIFQKLLRSEGLFLPVLEPIQKI